MSTGQRPFYLIAHQCNDISDIGGALDAGANGIELDVHWTSVNGEAAAWWVYHDDVTSPSYVNLRAWLDEASKQADTRGQQFALIYFDIKTPDAAGMSTLRDLTRAQLPSDLNVLFSTGDIPGTSDQFKDVAATDLRFNEGMAIDYENDCGAVARYFTGLGVKNYWYGDGISSLLPEPLSVRSSVQSGVNARGIFNEIRKVYVWSLANPDNIASYLDMGVDGILVEANPAGSFTGAYVEATVGQVNSRSDIRLATRSDFAFSRAITSDLPPGAFGGSIVEYWGGWPANFTPPLDAAMVLPGGRGYFFKGDQYFRYDDSGHAPANAPSSFVKGDWPNWPSDFYPIDAAVFWPPTGKVYFFKGDQYIRYNLPEYGGREGVDQGPSPIQGNWPGLVEALKLDANSGLDAAIYWPDGNAYFIKGEQCATYASGVNQGEPEGVVGVPIAFGDTVRKLLNFANIGPIKIDAGLYWPNGRVTLLMGANYFIYPTNKNLI